MKKKKVIRTIAVLGIAGLLTGGGIGLYMFNMPQRDVQSAQTDYTLTTTQIVTEYLSDREAANQKYLSADGDSKILEIAGEIKLISENYKGQKVVLLKSAQDKAGVSATFSPETTNNLKGIEIGQIITVKGVIRSGASYDEDLKLYENVLLDKSDIVPFTTSFATQAQERYVSSKTHIKFFSSTPVEDIEAHNYASVSTLDPGTGEVVFSVPIQSFEFEKAMMQQHFNNEHFLESNVYPKSKFKATITNLEDIDFRKNGEYRAEIEGEMTIKDRTNPVKETGTITVQGQTLSVKAVFSLALADYDITFDDSEMVSKKIAKSVEVTVAAEYIFQ